MLKTGPNVFLSAGEITLMLKYAGRRQFLSQSRMDCEWSGSR